MSYTRMQDQGDKSCCQTPNTMSLWNSVGECLGGVNKAFCNKDACECLCWCSIVTGGAYPIAYGALWLGVNAIPIAVGTACTPFTLCCDSIYSCSNYSSPAGPRDQFMDMPRKAKATNGTEVNEPTHQSMQMNVRSDTRLAANSLFQPPVSNDLQGKSKPESTSPQLR